MNGKVQTVGAVFGLLYIFTFLTGVTDHHVAGAFALIATASAHFVSYFSNSGKKRVLYASFFALAMFASCNIFFGVPLSDYF